ncbi:hypothetical protein GH714_041668 [Hevea brasiliensis]|uniref:AT-hook motif nuclear-localized protein n=1 Tax=Hevea brasiliensis TaxID=3981 RepID=A0A6A6MTG9_HEVBR|nr:hypothetical protein GH714_041668 [Hevea brasiliensis]
MRLVWSQRRRRGRPEVHPRWQHCLGVVATPISSSPNSLVHADPGGGTPGVASEPPSKRNRGRPPGSGKRQLDALGGVGGVGFTPHVITVKAGEPAMSGGTVTYEAVVKDQEAKKHVDENCWEEVIVGSFIADGKKSNSTISKSGPSLAPTNQTLNFGAPLTTSSPPSQGPSSESSDGNGSSPLNRDPGIYSNATQPIHSMNMYQLWAAPNPH